MERGQTGKCENAGGREGGKEREWGDQEREGRWRDLTSVHQYPSVHHCPSSIVCRLTCSEYASSELFLFSFGLRLDGQTTTSGAM